MMIRWRKQQRVCIFCSLVFSLWWSLTSIDQDDDDNGDNDDDMMKETTKKFYILQFGLGALQCWRRRLVWYFQSITNFDKIDDDDEEEEDEGVGKNGEEEDNDEDVGKNDEEDEHVEDVGKDDEEDEHVEDVGKGCLSLPIWHFLTLFKTPLTPPLPFEHLVDFFDRLGDT